MARIPHGCFRLSLTLAGGSRTASAMQVSTFNAQHSMHGLQLPTPLASSHSAQNSADHALTEQRADGMAITGYVVCRISGCQHEQFE